MRELFCWVSMNLRRWGAGVENLAICEVAILLPKLEKVSDLSQKPEVRFVHLNPSFNFRIASLSLSTLWHHLCLVFRKVSKRIRDTAGTGDSNKPDIAYMYIDDE